MKKDFFHDKLNKLNVYTYINQNKQTGEGKDHSMIKDIETIIRR